MRRAEEAKQYNKEECTVSAYDLGCGWSLRLKGLLNTLSKQYQHLYLQTSKALRSEKRHDSGGMFHSPAKLGGGGTCRSKPTSPRPTFSPLSDAGTHFIK